MNAMNKRKPMLNEMTKQKMSLLPVGATTKEEALKPIIEQRNQLHESCRVEELMPNFIIPI